MKNRLHAGMIMPPSDLTPCGRLTATPEEFYTSACDEADRLKSEMELAERSRILDVGCGVGRLPIGLLARNMPFLSYLGTDVSLRRIKWCKRNIQNKDNRLDFQFINLKNDRYNPRGKVQLDVGIKGKKFEIIYLYSVFSHLLQPDIEKYLGFFVVASVLRAYCGVEAIHCFSLNGLLLRRHDNNFPLAMTTTFQKNFLKIL